MSKTTFFVLASLAAGGINYLFQILASSRLDAQGFAAFNAWLAHISVLGLIPGLAQFYTSFFPTGGSRLRQGVLFANIFCLVIFASTLLTPHLSGTQWGFALVLLLTLVGWVNGQAQNRMLYATIGVADIVASTAKIASVLSPQAASTDAFIRAIFIGAFPALWVISYMVWRYPQSSARAAGAQDWRSAWMPPVAMSIASAFIPQMDTVLLVRTQPQEVFQDYSRAALFSKGVFFLFLIFAQWLLPRQIRGLETRWLARASSPLLAGAALIGAATVAGLSPYVAELLLKWDHAPSRQLVFESCLNMAILTSLFIGVQNACAKGFSRSALLALGALLLEFALQWLLHLDIDTYFLLAMILNLSLVVILHRTVRLKAGA